MNKEIPNNCYGDALREAYNKYHDKPVMVPLDDVIEYIGCWIKDEETDELYQPLIEGLKQKYGVK